MKKDGEIPDFRAYLELLENAVATNKSDIDTLLKHDKVRKTKLYATFKNEIEKISGIKHNEVDKEIEKLHKRVDRLFSNKQ